MSLRSITFLLSFAGVAFLIFLLTLLLYLIQEWIGNEAGDPASQESAAENDQRHGHDLQGQRIVIRDLINRIDAIANAIYAYNEKRDTHERRRSKNEKITIVALSLAAGFAFLTFVAAGISDVIFYGQLDEMQKSGVDTRALAEVSEKTFVMTERPWLYIDGNVKFVLGGHYMSNETRAIFSNDIINEGNSIAKDISEGARIQSRPFTSDVSYNDIPCTSKDVYQYYANFPFVPKTAIAPKRHHSLQFAVKHIGPTGDFVGTKLNRTYLDVCIQYGWPFTKQIFRTFVTIGISLIMAEGHNIAEPLNNETFGGFQVEGAISYIQVE